MDTRLSEEYVKNPFGEESNGNPLGKKSTMGRLIPDLPRNDGLAWLVRETYDVNPCFLTRPGRHYYIRCKLDSDKKVSKMGYITKRATASN